MTKALIVINERLILDISEMDDRVLRLVMVRLGSRQRNSYLVR